MRGNISHIWVRCVFGPFMLKLCICLYFSEMLNDDINTSLLVKVQPWMYFFRSGFGRDSMLKVHTWGENRLGVVLVGLHLCGQDKQTNPTYCVNTCLVTGSSHFSMRLTFWRVSCEVYYFKEFIIFSPPTGSQLGESFFFSLNGSFRKEQFWVPRKLISGHMSYYTKSQYCFSSWFFHCWAGK